VLCISLNDKEEETTTSKVASIDRYDGTTTIELALSVAIERRRTSS